MSTLQKITTEQMDAAGVCAAPNVLNGTTAENKAVFDRMIRQLIAPAYNAAVDAINAIEATEHGIEAAEALRAAAENLRSAAEQARASAEQERAASETARAAAALARAAAETAREQAESARRQAEQVRASAEQERSSAETVRVSAEAARAAAEAARAAAETARGAAEQKRASAEDGRAQAESARNAEEKKRADAELARISDEKNRAAAEQGRAAAETARQDLETGYVAQAAASARSAKEAADRAAAIVGGDYVTKVKNAADGNLAGLTASGELKDSGKKPGDFLERPAGAGGSKDTPADGDSVVLMDSADGAKVKGLLWSRVKAALGEVFAAKSSTGYTPASHAASHKKNGADALSPADIGACGAPMAVSVTLPASSWALVSEAYQQTAACAGLLATDTQATVTVLPNGGTDADAHILIDEAYAAVAGAGGKFLCSADGQLTAVCPKGGAAPTIDLPLIVCIAR